jgi:hypothetical protein
MAGKALTLAQAVKLAVEVIDAEIDRLATDAAMYKNFGEAYGTSGAGRLAYLRRERLKAARAILLELIQPAA